MTRLFVDGFDFRAASEAAAEVGYHFAHEALRPEAVAALLAEALRLELKLGDHVSRPIWPGTPREVRQLHERAYLPAGHPSVPAATGACAALRDAAVDVPALRGWSPTEVGYQRYRGPTDFISPHRDRRSDRLLSVTFTLLGSAAVRVLEPTAHPDDYTRLHAIDEVVARPATAMFLRAPGLGSGEQVVHAVDPPIGGPRVILNLRTRPDVLRDPA